MSRYQPQNWYWIVTASTTQVYSSVAAAYVSVSDTTYQAWLAAGNSPTKIDTEADLSVVFTNAGCPQCWYQNAPAIAAQTAIASGLQLTSTGTPALNGTYALDMQSLTDINGLVTGILLNGTFPQGASTYAYHDATNGAHTFPSVASFKLFATAALNFVSQVMQYARSGGSIGSIPANTITIA